MRTTSLIVLAIVIALAIAVLSATDWVITIPWDQFCDDDDPCMQQWIAALSGWVAAIATVITLLLFSQQIRDTRSHHMQTLRIENRAGVELATRVMSHSYVCFNIVSKGIMTINVDLPPLQLARQAHMMKHEVKFLIESIEQEDFDSFDKLIGSVGGTQHLALARKMARVLQDSITNLSLGLVDSADLVEAPISGKLTDAKIMLQMTLVGSVLSSCRNLGVYFVVIEEDAIAYLKPFVGEIRGFESRKQWEGLLREFRPKG